MNIVFGAGGIGRELDWLLAEGCADGIVEPDAFCVENRDTLTGATFCGKPLIVESDLLTVTKQKAFRAYIAIGTPAIKRKLVAWLEEHFQCDFPRVIHPSVPMDRREGKTKLGRGVLIYPGATITTEVQIGDFTHINPCATIGHQAVIGRNSTICPGSNISGNVSIGEDCFVGAGTVVREGVHIADNCLIGAGAVVVSDIDEAGTWAGVPARRLR